MVEQQLAAGGPLHHPQRAAQRAALDTGSQHSPDALPPADGSTGSGSGSLSSSGSGGISWESTCSGSTPRLLEAVSTELLDMYVRELLHNTQPCLGRLHGLGSRGGRGLGGWHLGARGQQLLQNTQPCQRRWSVYFVSASFVSASAQHIPTCSSEERSQALSP